MFPARYELNLYIQFKLISVYRRLKFSLANSEYLFLSSWNVTAHGDLREGKWRGNWRMEWVASALHTTSEHGVSRTTTADAHTSAASSRRPRRFKWSRPFRRKTKSVFCTCANTFKTQPKVWWRQRGTVMLLNVTEIKFCSSLVSALWRQDGAFKFVLITSIRSRMSLPLATVFPFL